MATLIQVPIGTVELFIPPPPFVRARLVNSAVYEIVGFCRRKTLLHYTTLRERLFVFRPATYLRSHGASTYTRAIWG